ncbi:MAG TPA: PAS domain S-box protein [Nitrospirae bacterium]|nr:PAS domain S-box protein [Nitrospirota bacterium]
MKNLIEEITEWEHTFDAIPDIILVIDNQYKIIKANKSAAEKLRHKRSDLIGNLCYKIFHKTDEPPSYCPRYKTSATKKEHAEEAYEENLKGHFLFSATPLHDSKGRITGTVEVARDISSLKLTTAELQEREKLFRSVTEFATDAIISIESSGRIVYWNRTAGSMFGYSPDEAVGEPLTIIIPKQFRQAHKKGIKRFLSSPSQKLWAGTYDVMALRKNGSEFPVELSLSNWESNGEIFFTGIIRDITERRQAEEKLHETSITDELTGLLNRRGFLTLSEKQFQIAKRNLRNFSILYADLNDMKRINDESGHKAGDRALVDIANVLRQTFRSSDIIARIGGDEFAVLITEPRSDDIENIAVKHLQENLEIHNEQMERDYKVSISMGMAHFDPKHPRSIDELLSRADKLMYINKTDQKTGRK